MHVRQLLTPVAAAALVLSVGSAQASISFFTDEASFLAALASSGTDTFNDLPGFEFLPLPQARSAGAFDYTISAPDGLFTIPGGGGTWMSTNALSANIDVTGTGIGAAGAFVFGTNFDGLVVPGLMVTLTATDALGTSASQSAAAASAGNFLGVVAMEGLASLSFSINDEYVTLNNLTLGMPIPEPGTYALMLGGLGLVGWMARRRRAD